LSENEKKNWDSNLGIDRKQPELRAEIVVFSIQSLNTISQTKFQLNLNRDVKSKTFSHIYPFLFPFLP